MFEFHNVSLINAPAGRLSERSRNYWHRPVCPSLSPSSFEEPDVAQERIIAVGLLTRPDLERLGPTFTRVWPVDETPCFSELLRAIDDADRDIRRAR